MKRIEFCGVIEGGVTVRKGETETEALMRAEAAICDVLGRHARRYHRSEEEGGGDGPIVGLEPK